MEELRWNHEALIDWLLANPDKTQGDCARYFGKSESWLSTLMSSDAFRRRFAERRDQLTGELNRSLTARLTSVAHQSLDVIGERLTREREKIPLADARETCTMALRALGYGAPQPARGVTVNGPAIVVTAEQLAEARALMRKREPQLIEAESAPAA